MIIRINLHKIRFNSPLLRCLERSREKFFPAASSYSSSFFLLYEMFWEGETSKQNQIIPRTISGSARSFGTRVRTRGRPANGRGCTLVLVGGVCLRVFFSIPNSCRSSTHTIGDIFPSQPIGRQWYFFLVFWSNLLCMCVIFFFFASSCLKAAFCLRHCH